MAIKIYKPTTPSRRETSVVDYKKVLSKNHEAPRRLLISRANSAGRNSSGKITVRHRGGGYKKIIREVDFVRIDKLDIPALVQTIEYDPNRTAFISLLAYRDGEKRYLLTPDGLKVGDTVITSHKAPIRVGNRLPVSAMLGGTQVHDLELLPGAGGKLARSAGSFVTVQAVEGRDATIKLPSGEIRKIPSACWATIGQVSNPGKMNVRIGRAGRRRLMGWRPSVRGKAMNPVDHPHGGGEGHNPIGMKYPKTPWGKHAIGVRTRRKKKYSNSRILSRRK